MLHIEIRATENWQRPGGGHHGEHSMIAGGDEHSEGCPFCGMGPAREIARNELAFAIRDSYPVTPMHALVLPRRHAPTYFDLTAEEILAIDALLRGLRADIVAADASVEGFNIGVNVGTVAGQTIFHCHVHLIPRRQGDVPDPWGGVRAIIPGKARYPASI
jgi:ATP adenylyltransferase